MIVYLGDKREGYRISGQGVAEVGGGDKREGCRMGEGKTERETKLLQML